MKQKSLVEERTADPGRWGAGGLPYKKVSYARIHMV